MIKLIRKISLVVSMILCGVLITGTVIAFENSAVVNDALNLQTFRIDNTDVDPEADTEYIKSSYTALDDLVKDGRETAAQIVEEGSVLLKNDNNALPLAKGTKVSLLGTTAYNPVYGGTGSGGISTTEAVSFIKSIKDAELEVNPTLEAQYTSSGWNAYRRNTSGSYGKAVHKINEVPWAQFTSNLLASMDEYNTAVVFIGRNGGEGNDLRNYPLRDAVSPEGNSKGHDGIDNGDGLGLDYLGLNQNEIDLFKGLKARKDAGQISKIITVINFAAMMEGNFIKDPQYGIDSALWVGTPGLGGAGVGKLLVGDASPSGRLSDTMFLDNAANPVNVNFTPRMYDGTDAVGIPTKWGTGNYPAYTMAAYVVYQEGMYLGYRYTETRYEDTVLGTSNVGNYNYNDVVAYPFGYGLSYASFETSDISVTKTGDREYTVSVKVTNNSAKDVSGKYSVPIYVSKPYGDYAKRNGIQVPSVELIDFVKTSTLKKGESETLTTKLDEKFFASYDAEEAKTYVLMGGDYYVCVGGSAHEAANNMLMAKKARGVSINESKMVGTGNASKVVRFNLSENKVKYSRSDGINSLTGQANPRITNLFDFSDINRYSGRGSNKVNYYNRSDWAGTVSLDMVDGHPKLTATEQMAREMFAQVPFEVGSYGTGVAGTPEKYKQPIPTDDVAYPTMGANNGLSLVDLMYDSEGKRISYNDSVWDLFLDQLTWEDLKLLPATGQRSTAAIASVNKPGTRHNNGPNGFNQKYTNSAGLAYKTEILNGNVGTNGAPVAANSTSVAYRDNLSTTGFPSNALLAAALNKELASKSGKIMGEDGLWSGNHGLFGLGLNIHRSSYLGRVCEYYSECGTLTGIIGALQTREMEARGVHVFNKHCALNDMETNRHGACNWINEQALREIYLRAFELPVYAGGNALMSSFARFGTYSGAACKALNTDFFRGEVGLLGPVVTDYYGDMNGSTSVDPYFEMTYGVYSGGSDLCDGDVTSSTSHFSQFDKGNYGEMAWAMRNSAKRILYYTLTSFAMNGMASGSKIVRLTPFWQPLLIALSAGTGAIFAGLSAWTVVAMVLGKRKL